MRSSLAVSPSNIVLTGMPVQRATTPGDVGCLDHIVQPRRRAPAVDIRFVLACQLQTIAFEHRRAGIVVVRIGFVFVDFQLRQPPLGIFQRDRLGEKRHAQSGAGFVHQVDGLVGQVAVGDVAMRELGRGHQRRVRE